MNHIIIIITVPDLRKQIVFHQCLKREDITGISSFTLNEFGEAVYQVLKIELKYDISLLITFVYMYDSHVRI